MSQVNRICAQCGEGVPLQDRYCSECGYDTRSGLPTQRDSLPVKVGRAALPVIAGLAGIVLRSGFQMLQRRIAHMAQEQQANPESRRTSPQTQSPARPRRTIRIRSFWAVGGADGVWRQGREEHTIEIED